MTDSDNKRLLAALEANWQAEIEGHYRAAGLRVVLENSICHLRHVEGAAATISTHLRIRLRCAPR